MPTTPNAALRARRERARLSIQALADLAGVSRSSVSLIESGKRYGTDDTLRKLALALEIDATKIGGRAA